MNRTRALPSDWTDQDNFWLGKTYDKARAQSSLKPVPAQPPSKGDEEITKIATISKEAFAFLD